jgi:uncharacterized damage-inducible protein DinB
MDLKKLFEHWNDVRSGLLSALDLLTDEQLAFTPREGLWSLGETVCHIAGAEEGWFRYVVTHELGGWDEADFQLQDYPTVEALKGLLVSVHDRTESMFAGNADAKMAEIVELPWGGKVSIGWVVWHILEHDIHHRGEVYLMLGLMGIEAPDV